MKLNVKRLREEMKKFEHLCAYCEKPLDTDAEQREWPLNTLCVDCLPQQEAKQ